jgi:hypothetical protein
MFGGRIGVSQTVAEDGLHTAQYFGRFFNLIKVFQQIGRKVYTTRLPKKYRRIGGIG